MIRTSSLASLQRLSVMTKQVIKQRMLLEMQRWRVPATRRWACKCGIRCSRTMMMFSGVRMQTSATTLSMNKPSKSPPWLAIKSNIIRPSLTSSERINQYQMMLSSVRQSYTTTSRKSKKRRNTWLKLQKFQNLSLKSSLKWRKNNMKSIPSLEVLTWMIHSTQATPPKTTRNEARKMKRRSNHKLKQILHKTKFLLEERKRMQRRHSSRGSYQQHSGVKSLSLSKLSLNNKMLMHSHFRCNHNL